VAALIGILVMAATLGGPAMVIGLVLATSAGFLMAWLCLWQIGGQTGDVLGALEQVIETVIMLTAVAMSGTTPGLRL
jgi:adenosylcobinamide-GDP ribazoletransferase